LTLAAFASCSVFPDEATLPTHASGDAGAAGEGTPDGAGSGGTANAGGAAQLPEAGAGATSSNQGGSGVTEGGAAGQPGNAGGGAGPDAGAGAGGAGEAPCINPQTVKVVAETDTWIGSANPDNNHGSDKLLSVVAGTDEHRALVALTLPKALAGLRFHRATLRFHLESNADAGLASRRLTVHRLSQAFDEGRATWNEFGKKLAWQTPGGDFGASWDSATVPTGTATANIDFDVTASVAKLLGSTAIPLSLLVRETSAARPFPAGLAFASTEGNAPQIPELSLEYCDP
jgi:hypothetical protein